MTAKLLPPRFHLPLDFLRVSSPNGFQLCALHDHHVHDNWVVYVRNRTVLTPWTASATAIVKRIAPNKNFVPF